MTRLSCISQVVILYFVLWAWCVQAQDSEFRKWRDVSGQFEIEATFVRLDGGSAVLRKKDGAQLSVALNRLCAEDRRWISEQQAGAAKQAAEVFQVESLADPVWKLTPNSLTMNGDSPQSIYLPLEVDSYPFASRQIIASRDGSHVLATFNDIGFLADYAGKNSLLTTKIDEDLEHAALSNDGRFVLRTHVLRSTVEVVELSSGTGKVVQKLDAGDRIETPNATDVKLTYVDFAGNDIVITACKDGVVVAWNLQNGKPIWWLSAPGCVPAITPGGKYVIAYVEDGLTAIDVVSGKMVAKIKIPYRGLERLLVSPNGNRIAGIGSSILRIWSFDDGSLFRDIADYSFGQESAFAWIDDRYFAFADTFGGGILDTEIGLVIWTFHGTRRERLAIIPNYGIWLFVLTPQLMVEPFPIPGDCLNDASELFSQSDHTIMGPNVPIDLQYQLDGIPSNVFKSIDQRVRQCLSDSGIRISEDAMYELKIQGGASVNTQGSEVTARLILAAQLVEKGGAQIWYHLMPRTTIDANSNDPDAYAWLDLPRRITRIQGLGGVNGFQTGYNKMRTVIKYLNKCLESDN